MVCLIFSLLTRALPAGQTLGFLLIFLMPLQTLYGQNNALRGKVLYLSSGKTPAVGVEISGTIKQGEQANTVYTTDLGTYHLVFPKAGEGQRVNLVIGDRDAGNTQLELVNEKEVDGCRIPANPTEEFEIIVAKKGYRDLVAQKYYRIIRTSADLVLTQTKQELDQLFQQQEKDYEQISSMSAKIKKLKQENDSLAIYREAYRIATINKDDASARVLRYLQLLDEGKSIQEAREALSINKAAKDMGRGIGFFHAGMEELETRASASASIFDYQDAIACYDTLISYSEKLGLDPLRIADQYFQKGKYLYLDGKFNAALEFFEKTLVFQRQTLADADTQIILTTEAKGNALFQLGRYDESLHCHQEVLSIRKNKYQSDDIRLAPSYNNIGNVLQALGEYEQALNSHQKCVDLREKDPATNRLDLANSYSNYSITLYFSGKLTEAIHNQQKAINIREELLKATDPDLALSYQNLSNFYSQLGQYEQALSLQQKAIQIQEKNLNPNHPGLVADYGNLGSIYSSLNQHEQAITFARKAALIQEEIDPLHPKMAITYGKLGVVYRDAGQYENALTFQRKAIDLKKSLFGFDHPRLLTTYSNIGHTHNLMGQYELALEYFWKAKHLFEENLDTTHYNLGILYSYITDTLIKLKEFDKAKKSLKKCKAILSLSFPSDHPYFSRINSGWSEIYEKEGIDHFDNGNYQAAVAAFDTVIAKNGVHFDASDSVFCYLGLSHLHLSNFSEAGNCFEKAEQYAPDAFHPHRNWAIYYALQNQSDQAYSHLQQAFDLGYTRLEWLETDPLLKNLRKNKGFRNLEKKRKR